jgi:hypothetical protein
VPGVFLIVVFALTARAGDGGFSVEKTDAGVTVNLNGELFTKYVIGEANKPFLWPVIGPNGDPITRAYPMADVEGERKDHPHHRSIWFGHQEVGGFDTWHERLTIEERAKKKPEKLEEMLAVLGATVHREFVEASAADDGKTATIVTKNDYTDNKGKVMCSDVRTLTFRVGDDDVRIIDFDITFHGGEEPTLLGDAKDAGFSVRVPTSMDVDSEPGGNILNSEGDTDKDAWGKRAKWCSYFGPVGEKSEKMAVTILNHPKSFRHPTPWHVRSYGLFTANAFGTKSLDKGAEDGSLTLKPGDTLALRHRAIFHRGAADAKQIDAAFAAYAKE